MLLPKELRDMLLRCCKDELGGLAAEVARRRHAACTARKPVNIQLRLRALKHSLHNDVSGKNTRSCNDAAFMHALLKQKSHTDAR